MRTDNAVVLRYFTDTRDGRPLFFHRMTAIGPATTADLSKASVFADEQTAKRSPAYLHPLCGWRIEDAP